MRSREARLSKCCGVRGSGSLPVAAEAAAETREEADGEVRPHSATQRTQVAVHEVGIVKCQNVVDTSGGKQAAEMAQARLEAEGNKQGTLIRCIHAKRVGGWGLEIGEKQPVKDSQEAAGLTGTARHKVLHEGIVPQRRAQHWVPAPRCGAVATEHGATTSIKGEGWVTKGEDSWLKGSHGALAIDACPSERRAIDRGLAWCTDKTNRTGAAVYRLGVSRGRRRRRSRSRESAEGLRHHTGRSQDVDVVRVGEHDTP